MHRKVLLRRRLLRWQIPNSPVYVPYIGDGDIANELYRDRPLFGADIDEERIETAAQRFPGQQVIVGDVEGDYYTGAFPFEGLTTRFGIADFDAYASPYPAFRAFWEAAAKEDTLLVFFTDGHYMAMERTGWFYPPDGSPKRWLPVSSRETGWERMVLAHQWLQKAIWPWFEDYIQPYEVVQRWRYRRMHVIYWGAVLKVPTQKDHSGDSG